MHTHTPTTKVSPVLSIIPPYVPVAYIPAVSLRAIFGGFPHFKVPVHTDPLWSTISNL